MSRRQDHVSCRHGQRHQRGTGQSDLTWQAAGGIGYKFGWGQVFGVWRYLDYNFKSSAKIEDVDFNGPALGVAFYW